MPRVRVRVWIEARYRPFYLDVWCSACGLVASWSAPDATVRRIAQAHRRTHRRGDR